MSLSVYTKKSKEKLMLSHKPFASGGEGHLYRIIAPRSFSNSVVKIYHPNKLSPTREAKIDYLLEYPPQHKGQNAIVWVQDSIRDAAGNFLGFVMPLVEGEKLEILCTSNLPKKLANTWYRFHNKADNALELRLKVCYNLATAIHQIHASKRYILVDLKPDNIIITLDGLISLVDLDSVEVVENGQKLFDAPVATPEYTPPEYYNKNNAHDPTQQQAWDRFSMAVIFYKLLMGIHPFAGSFRSPYDNATTLAKKIEHHLFVFNPEISSYKKSIPPPHESFYHLSQEFQDLFLQAFVTGSKQPELRPTAHAWCSAIMQHLDIQRFRVLPSKLIQLPENQTLLEAVYQASISPDAFIQELKMPTNNSLITSFPTKKSDATFMLPLRRINAAILALGLTYGLSNIFFNNNLPVGYLVVLITVVSSMTILLFSFFSRQNNREAYLLKISLSETLKFAQKQQQIFEGIKEHLEQFWKRLNQEHSKFFPNASQNQHYSIQQSIAHEFKRLQEDLERQDKLAKDLIQSETFEYTALKKKYNRALHTNSEFAAATSLDAELSAIDFALQESMEDLQKTLGKELKATQLEYDQVVEKDQRRLRNLERSVQQKIGQYRKTSLQAKKQEEKKTLIKMKRQIQKDFANVPNNIATKISLFKDEIKHFLNQHNIQDIHQIKNIQAPGIVTLEDDKKVSIAPLKYYQIHELLEWWMAVKLGEVELSKTLKEQIHQHYEDKFQGYKKKLMDELKKVQQETAKRKQSIQKEASVVLKKLREKNTPQIAVLKEKYAQQKAFLEQLFEARKIEETEIHERYQTRFDALLEEAQTRANRSKEAIQTIYQANTADFKRIAAYQKNRAKYTIGLERLKEEYSRLKDSRSRYQRTKEQAQKYQEIDLWKHLQQMFFIAPI